MQLFTLESCLLLSGALFLIGACGLLLRRNLLQIFLSLEILLNGVNLSLIAFNYFLWSGTPAGHYLYMLSIGVAAVEAAIGLSLLIALFRNSGASASDALESLGDRK
jgi:NADH-quinone oxidoreductase subunit K